MTAKRIPHEISCNFFQPPQFGRNGVQPSPCCKTIRGLIVGVTPDRMVWPEEPNMEKLFFVLAYAAFLASSALGNVMDDEDASGASQTATLH